VIAGLQPSSSLRMDKHTVPDGYTFGWNSGGTNLPEDRDMSALVLLEHEGMGNVRRTLRRLCRVLVGE
jgi:hypothetical protein